MNDTKQPKSNIERAAKTAHEANRVYCESHGDMSQPAWGDAPKWQTDSARNGALAIAIDPDLSPESSHKSWLSEKEADGWVYGETKDPDKKTHPCMVPYADLPEIQRYKDELFGIVVRGCLLTRTE